MIIQPNKELTDAIRRYQAGDTAAFDAIYYGSVQYITKCVLNVLHRTAPGAPEDLKQDIIQDTYLTIAEKLHTLQAPEAFFQWAGQIATRHAQRTWNKEASRQQMERAEEDLDFELIDEEFIPEDILENRETQQQIRKLLEELPTNQYLCIVEYFYNGLKETEVADKLDMPVNTVKTNLSRAKKKLKALFENESKRGVKLCSMGGMLLLLLLQDLRIPLPMAGNAEGTLEAIRGKMGTSAGASASASGGTAASAGTAAATAAGGLLSTLAGKMIAGVLAAAVLIGAAIGGNALLKKLPQASETEPSFVDYPENYDPITGEYALEPWHSLSMEISSPLGEQWDGEFTYRIEDSANGETLSYGSAVRMIEDIIIPPGAYTVIVEAPGYRSARLQVVLENQGYSRMFLDLVTDGSWLAYYDMVSIVNWLQYLDLPVGTREVPSVFVNDGSEENASIIWGTAKNALPCEMRMPSLAIHNDAEGQFTPLEGSAFAQRYTQELFGYLPEGGVPEQLLQLPETENELYFDSKLLYFEQLDAERIRVHVQIRRNLDVIRDGVIYVDESVRDVYCIAATLRCRQESVWNWVLETAVCYTPAEVVGIGEQYEYMEASPTDEEAYTQLLSRAVDVRDWEEKGPVVLTKEQRERMESVLLCTAYADSGIISRMNVASYGALLADVYVDPEPFLKVSKPAENNWDKCEVLLLLAWNREGIQNITADSSNSRNYGGSLSYDLTAAEALMRGLFGQFDASELTTNIIIKGYMTEIAGGKLYQPKARVYDCRYGNGYGTLTIDQLERTGSGTIRIYATYSASMNLRCVYEATENPNSYIGYTLTGVSYTYAE